MMYDSAFGRGYFYRDKESGLPGDATALFKVSYEDIVNEQGSTTYSQVLSVVLAESCIASLYWQTLLFTRLLQSAVANS